MVDRLESGKHESHSPDCQLFGQVIPYLQIILAREASEGVRWANEYSDQLEELKSGGSSCMTPLGISVHQSCVTHAGWY